MFFNAFLLQETTTSVLESLKQNNYQSLHLQVTFVHIFLHTDYEFYLYCSIL